LDQALLIEQVESAWESAKGGDFFKHTVSCCDVDRLYRPALPLERITQQSRIGPVRITPVVSGGTSGSGGIVPQSGLGGRMSDGSAGNYLETSGSTNGSLQASNGPFTVSLFMKTSDLSQISKTLFVFRALFFTGWALDFGAIPGCVRFYSEFYTGDNPITDSEIAIVDDRWHHIAFRKQSAGTSAWDKFLDGATASINPAATFTLPSNVFFPRAFRDGTGTEFKGSIARIAVWNQALTDDEIRLVASGTHANVVHPGGLLQYWPISGTSDPEPNNGTAGLTHPTLTVNGDLPAST
jgi:hypothetical protein